VGERKGKELLREGQGAQIQEGLLVDNGQFLVGRNGLGRRLICTQPSQRSKTPAPPRIHAQCRAAPPGSAHGRGGAWRRGRGWDFDGDGGGEMEGG
jgi:hypothetical protein